MKVVKFINGFIYREKDVNTDEELQKAINDGFVQISDEDYKLYSTLDYVYDNGKPKKITVFEPQLDELKAAKLAEVNAWTAAKITGGFISEATGEPIIYDSDVDTQITVSRMRANCENQRFAELYPKGMECRGRREEGVEKEIFMLQPAAIIRLDEDLGIHIRKCKLAGWTQQAKVKAAQTKEDLEAIILN